MQVRVAAELPSTIVQRYEKQSGVGINDWGKLVDYKQLDVQKRLGYLKLETFSTWRIDNDSVKFPAFLEQLFTKIKQDKIENLIVDIRNNEGGDDVWQLAMGYFREIERGANSGLPYIQNDKFSQYTDYCGWCG